MTEVWYRYEETLWAPSLNEWEEPVGRGSISIRLQEFPVLKHTPKGVWLFTFFGDKRFVLRDARKRFACPTKEEALESFIARKKRQATIFESRARNARLAIKLAEEGKIGVSIPK